MNINFNNVRKQACIAYDKLVSDLTYSKSYEGYMLVDPDRLEKNLNDLRMMLCSIAMTFEENNDEFKDVYEELYPQAEGNKMAEFEFFDLEDE